MTTLGDQISENIINAMNTSDNPRINEEKEPKNALITLGLWPVKWMRSTAGVRTKN